MKTMRDIQKKDKRSHLITVRFNDSEYEKLIEESIRRGRYPISYMIREGVLQIITKEAK